MVDGSLYRYSPVIVSWYMHCQHVGFGNPYISVCMHVYCRMPQPIYTNLFCQQSCIIVDPFNLHSPELVAWSSKSLHKARLTITYASVSLHHSPCVIPSVCAAYSSSGSSLTSTAILCAIQWYWWGGMTLWYSTLPLHVQGGTWVAAVALCILGGLLTYIGLVELNTRVDGPRVEYLICPPQFIIIHAHQY